jgi:hypothetical protein
LVIVMRTALLASLLGGLCARAAFSQPSAQPAALVGRVLDERTEAPVAQAVLEVPALGLAVRADSTGAVRLAHVPPGAHRVRVRALGYTAVDAVLRFAPAATVESDFLLAPVAPRLSTVRVEAPMTAVGRMRLREFEERRKVGMGKFLDADYFEQNPGRSVGTLIQARVPGLRIVGFGSSEQLFVSGRGRRTNAGGARGCVPRMIVNGLPRDTLQGFRVGALQASEVIGFEFYTPSTVPAQYNIAGQRGGESGSDCGTAIFWTK